MAAYVALAVGGNTQVITIDMLRGDNHLFYHTVFERQDLQKYIYIAYIFEFKAWWMSPHYIY